MFTRYMTEEELQAAAYHDFLEIRAKVDTAFAQFVKRIKLLSGQRRAIHSVIENKTITTKSNNTWHVVFFNPGYTPTNVFYAGRAVYIPLYRGDEVDYLFINNTKTFVLQRVTAHFLKRYKERYLDYYQINLRGIHPALYYVIYNSDNTLTQYLPEKWSEEEMKTKSFYISKQGLSLVRFNKKLVTFITFLDQENLSRYKAMVYEEEAFWKDLHRVKESNKYAFDDALYKKWCADPEKTKRLLRGYLTRTSDKNKRTDEVIEQIMKEWDKVVMLTEDIESGKQKIEADSKPRHLFDVKGLVSDLPPEENARMTIKNK